MNTSLILNSPYAAPSKHWKFAEEGKPHDLTEGRRTAGYMIADPQARPYQDGGIFFELPLVNQIRQRVDVWRVIISFGPEHAPLEQKQVERALQEAQTLVPKPEIDEALIEGYRGTQSLPFELGQNNRIAVKIVDDRGVESLKVVEVTRPEIER